MFQQIIAKIKTWFQSESSKQNNNPDREYQLQKRNLSNLESALVNLIFNRKKLDQKKGALQVELIGIEQDITQLASEDRDDLAIALIDRRQMITDEMQFLVNQAKEINSEVEKAKHLKKQLETELKRYEILGHSVKARHEILQVKRSLQSQISSLTESVDSFAYQANLNSPLNDSILKLEAENEVRSGGNSDNTASQIRSYRYTKRQKELHETLRQIKANLKLNGKYIGEAETTEVVAR